MPPPAIHIVKQRGMMIAAVIVFGELALAINRAPELAAPDHQRVVEQPALLQILDQRRAGWSVSPALVGDAASAGCRADPSRGGTAE